MLVDDDLDHLIDLVPSQTDADVQTLLLDGVPVGTIVGASGLSVGNITILNAQEWRG